MEVNEISVQNCWTPAEERPDRCYALEVALYWPCNCKTARLKRSCIKKGRFSLRSCDGALAVAIGAGVVVDEGRQASRIKSRNKTFWRLDKPLMAMVATFLGPSAVYTTLPSNSQGFPGTARFLVWPRVTTREEYKFKSGCQSLLPQEQTLIFALTPVSSSELTTAQTCTMTMMRMKNKPKRGDVETRPTRYERADFALKKGAISACTITCTSLTSFSFPTLSSHSRPHMSTIRRLPPPPPSFSSADLLSHERKASQSAEYGRLHKFSATI